jgi:hypothetical protein
LNSGIVNSGLRNYQKRSGKEIRRQIEEKYNPKLSSKRRTSRGKLGQDSGADDWGISQGVMCIVHGEKIKVQG